MYSGQQHGDYFTLRAQRFTPLHARAGRGERNDVSHCSCNDDARSSSRSAEDALKFDWMFSGLKFTWNIITSWDRGWRGANVAKMLLIHCRDRSPACAENILRCAFIKWTDFTHVGMMLFNPFSHMDYPINHLLLIFKKKKSPIYDCELLFIYKCVELLSFHKGNFCKRETLWEIKYIQIYI